MTTFWYGWYGFAPRRVESRRITADLDPKAQQGLAERQMRMRVRIIAVKDDHDAFDREYFAALSPGEKMEMVGQMFAEQWLLMGGNAKDRADIERLTQDPR